MPNTLLHLHPLGIILNIALSYHHGRISCVDRGFSERWANFCKPQLQLLPRQKMARITFNGSRKPTGYKLFPEMLFELVLWNFTVDLYVLTEGKKAGIKNSGK